jgi:hypothetical protein
MKKVIIPNESHRSILEGVKNIDISNVWSKEADIVFYEKSLGKALSLWSKEDNIKNFVSVKNFLQDGEIEFNQKILFKLGTSCLFTSETIKEVKEKTKLLVDSLDLSNEFGDFKRYISTIIIELVQNAIIKIKEEQSDSTALLEILENEKSFCFQVTDSLGLLDRVTVLEKLKRAFETQSYEEKKSGAGLGFYMLLDASDKLIFLTEPNKKTTVKCIINKYKRLKEYKNKNVSIHFID